MRYSEYKEKGAYQIGANDCGAFIGRYILAKFKERGDVPECYEADFNKYVRPMSKMERARIMLQARGPLRFFDAIFRRAGLRPVDYKNLTEDDVVIFTEPTAFGGYAVGIYSGGDMVVTVSEQGDIVAMRLDKKFRKGYTWE